MHAHNSQSLDRCAVLDETLSRLARANPSTKFLRARAGALGFATSTSKSNSSSLLRAPFSLHRTPSRKILVPGRFAEEDEEEEDDEYGSDGDRSDGGWEDDEVLRPEVAELQKLGHAQTVANVFFDAVKERHLFWTVGDICRRRKRFWQSRNQGGRDGWSFRLSSLGVTQLGTLFSGISSASGMVLIRTRRDRRRESDRIAIK